VIKFVFSYSQNSPDNPKITSKLGMLFLTWHKVLYHKKWV